MIIDRYLIRLVLLPTLAGFALLILLVSAFNAAALLRDAAYSRIPMDQVFTLIGLRDVIAAEVLLPTSLYMGVLTTLNQWHRDREAYALYAAGVVPGRIGYPVWMIALLICACVAGLSLYARPWAYAESYRLDAESGQLTTSAMQPDHFYSFGGSLVLSAASIDRAGNLMHSVFVETKDDENVRVIRSESGKHLRRRQDQSPAHRTAERHQLFDRRSLARGPYPSSKDSSYYAASERHFRSSEQTTRVADGALVTATAPKERAELQWRLCLPVIASS